MISPTTYPDPPLAAVIVETVVPSVKVILPVKPVPVPDDPEILYVPADPVTFVKLLSRALVSVDIIPLSTSFEIVVEVAEVNDPDVTLVTNKELPPF